MASVSMFADGTVRVSWVTTITNPNAPTVAELNAGIALEQQITADGLDIGGSTADVDVSSLASTQDSIDVGRVNYNPINLTLKRAAQKLSSDPVRAALAFRALGYLVVRRGIDSTTAFASTQEVEVYPGRCGAPTPIKNAANDTLKYQVPVKVLDVAYPNAVVAA